MAQWGQCDQMGPMGRMVHNGSDGPNVGEFEENWPLPNPKKHIKNKDF